MSAAEYDLRGEVALAIMAFLTWAEFHLGATSLLDGTADRWPTCIASAARVWFKTPAGVLKPRRALTNTRAVLARYVAHGEKVPEWLPASLAALLKEPGTDTASAATTTAPPTENATTTTGQRCASVAIVPENHPLKPRERKDIMAISQETRGEISRRVKQLEFLAEHAPSVFAGIMSAVHRDHAAAERALEHKLRTNAVNAEATTKTAIGVLFGRG